MSVHGISLAQGKTHSIVVETASGQYTIVVGTHTHTSLAPLLNTKIPCAQFVVIADRTVASLHGDTLRRSLSATRKSFGFIDIEPGEASKSISTASRIYDQLASIPLGRDGAIIAFGGGVTGDLAGFVAATWMRGVPFVQVPTTLEAAIDASVGGKTGVNHAAGKNLIGAFHQPAAVVIDTDFLTTLPARDHVAALAESVKHALIADAGFFDWHERHAERITQRDPSILAELIQRNCVIKARIVSQDERERGLRAVLNYGHTVGHALEHVFAYELRHGECVALGILVENEIARSRGALDPALCERTRRLLHTLGLPLQPPRSASVEPILAACRLDKKNRAGAVHCALLRALGQAEMSVAVGEPEIAAALRAVAPTFT